MNIKTIAYTATLLIGLWAVQSEGITTLKFRALAAVNGIFGAMSSNASIQNKILDLEAQNTDLRSLLLLKEASPDDYYKMYSIYPFNNLREIAIAAGENHGIREGQVVTHETNILLGIVKKVFDNYSTVTTIFDPKWKIEVRVGNSETDALFVGGQKPSLSLLAKDARVEVGDMVLTANIELPYGLLVGKVSEIKEGFGSPLKEALIEPAVQLKNVRNVKIRN